VPWSNITSSTWMCVLFRTRSRLKSSRERLHSTSHSRVCDECRTFFSGELFWSGLVGSATTPLRGSSCKPAMWRLCITASMSYLNTSL
jgi:hypothetical protein